MTDVLLGFMEQEAGQVKEDDNVDTLMGCCQCLNKIIVQKGQAIDLQTVVERSVPISLFVLGVVQNPEVLWPMVNLVSNIVSRVEFKSEVIVKSI